MTTNDLDPLDDDVIWCEVLPLQHRYRATPEQLEASLAGEAIPCPECEAHFKVTGKRLKRPRQKSERTLWREAISTLRETPDDEEALEMLQTIQDGYQDRKERLEELGREVPEEWEEFCSLDVCSADDLDELEGALP